MAAVTSKKIRDAEVPNLVNGITWHKISFSDTNALASNADTIELFDIDDVEIVDAALYISATLGTGATLRLQAGSTNLTAASTAAAANELRMNVTPKAITTSTTVQLLVGGANLTADATVTAWVATRNIG